jgi:hypothetical protein
MAGGPLEIQSWKIWRREMQMNRRVLAAMVMGASLLASEAMYAAPVAFHVPVQAMFGNQQLVKMSLRNNTKQLIKVKVGDKEMALQPGATISLKLTDGDKIVAEEATPTTPAGTVLAVVSKDLSDATLIIN